MDEHTHHKELIDGVSHQFSEIFENSEHGMYIYLDDTHKVCNKKFSDMLGYESPYEWAENEESFTHLFIDDDSAERLVMTYSKAMQKMAGSQIEVTWKKKTGEKVMTNVILVPIAFEGHTFALHFISPL